MSLTPLIDAVEIKQARDLMLDTLRRGQPKLRRWIGWQGGSGEYDLTWIAHAGFWVSADHFADEDRWVLFFGSDNPSSLPMVGIDCEINPPKFGINRRCAGLFVRDAKGSIYFTHSGKLGGGRKGIGKSNFLASYRGGLETVDWPTGQPTEVIVLGRIDSPRLPLQISNFIQEVRRFKALVGTQGVTSIAPPPALTAATEPGFNPEFSGKRKGYKVCTEIEARCDHGIVISTLAALLEEGGFSPKNDKNRDLFINFRPGIMRVLFEAKTSVTTSTTYQAIGQLLYHSAGQSPAPRLVMVLPGTPDDKTARILKSLSIEVLAYELTESKPDFPDINALIVSLATRPKSTT